MKKLAIILLLFLIVLPGCKSEGPVETNGGQEKGLTVEDNRMYTLDKYRQIKIGDTYETVRGLLNDSPGEIMVDNARLKQYKWVNEDQSSLSVTFYDNQVTAKTQDGLGPLLTGSQRVTLAKYRQLKEGLSLEEVVAILGPGTEMMLTTGEGQEKVIYNWKNQDGGMISVTLEGDRVAKINQLMLK